MANKLGLRQPVARITITLEASNKDSDRVYRKALELTVAEYRHATGRPAIYIHSAPGKQTLLDFERRHYEHGGKQIWITPYEQLALLNHLIVQPEASDRDVTQALYRVRRRFGKDFLA